MKRYKVPHCITLNLSETEVSEQVYCMADRKQKTKIIDEFTATTGYNRKYAIHLLKNSAHIKVTHLTMPQNRAYRSLQKHAKSEGITSAANSAQPPTQEEQS